MSLSKGWPAPAKINRFLHITGRRSDGYHLLQTLFHLLDFGDTLDFDITATGEISTLFSIPGVPTEANLIVRAARLLQQQSQSKHGVAINLIKRLPMGGGLGGGSSDAATTLVALNHLWDCGFSQQALAHMGATLGADVPVFVMGHTAWGEGIGDQLTPVDLEEEWFLVLIPPIHISTADIFSAQELTRDCSAIKIRAFLEGIGTNVCQPVATKRYPELGRAVEWLAHYGDARMTGTGAAIFAPFQSYDAAKQVEALIPSEWRSFVAQGCNVSPLQHRLTQAQAG